MSRNWVWYLYDNKPAVQDNFEILQRLHQCLDYLRLSSKGINSSF